MRKKRKATTAQWKLLHHAWFRRLLYVNNRPALAALFTISLLVLIGAGAAGKNSILSIMSKPDYTPLLSTIAKGESNGNYNAYFGNPGNNEIRFTDMTVRQVLLWQDEYVRLGNPSSAVGKYQIINTTLTGLVKELGVGSDEVFDTALQDRMAVALLERRGAKDFVTDKLTREQFAANLAREWAALPRVTGPNPEQSYYAGDGLNSVRITIEEVFTALATVKSQSI